MIDFVERLRWNAVNVEADDFQPADLLLQTAAEIVRLRVAIEAAIDDTEDDPLSALLILRTALGLRKSDAPEPSP